MTFIKKARFYERVSLSYYLNLNSYLWTSDFRVINVSLMAKFNLSGQSRPNVEPKIGIKQTTVYSVFKGIVLVLYTNMV